jgi:hypothetical protein
MAKNKTKNTEPVKVKIREASMVASVLFLVGEKGKQVEMSAKDAEYVEGAIKRFDKAQQLLKKYYDREL